jgi:hypothetical protein
MSSRTSFCLPFYLSFLVQFIDVCHLEGLCLCLFPFPFIFGFLVIVSSRRLELDLIIFMSVWFCLLVLFFLWPLVRWTALYFYEAPIHVRFIYVFLSFLTNFFGFICNWGWFFCFVLITFILTHKIKPAGWQQTPQINHTIQKVKIEKEIEKWI